jgi:RimJ/RimL family protein N-acetyltransferase
MYGLLIDHDQAVAKWAYSTFNIYEQPVNKSLGVVDSNGKLVGAILFQNFNGVNLELSYYGHRTLTLGITRVIARIALGHFNASRLTVVTSRRNKRLIRGLIKIGFRLEGTQRCFYGHEDNKKNTGVRLVAFREQLSRVAYKTTPEQKLIRNK